MKTLISIILLLLPNIMISQLVVTKAPKFEYQIDDMPKLKLQPNDSVKIVSVFQISPNYKGGGVNAPKQKGSLLYEFEFDKNGRNVSINEYNRAKKINFTYKIKYDGQKKISQKLNRKGKLKFEKIYQDGRIHKNITFGKKLRVDRSILYFYKNDTLLESVFILNKENDTIYRSLLTYDSLNRVTEKKQFKQNELIGIRKISYNKDNEIDKLYFYPHNLYSFNPTKFIENISAEDLNKIEIPYATAEFYYDDDDLEKIKQLKPNGTISYITTYKLNANKQLFEVETNKNTGKNYRKVEYKYNSSNKLIQNTIKGFLLGSPVIDKEIKAEYDSNGRLLRYLAYNNEIPQKIIHNFEYEFY